MFIIWGRIVWLVGVGLFSNLFEHVLSFFLPSLVHYVYSNCRFFIFSIHGWLVFYALLLYMRMYGNYRYFCIVGGHFPLV